MKSFRQESSPEMSMITDNSIPYFPELLGGEQLSPCIDQHKMSQYVQHVVMLRRYEAWRQTAQDRQRPDERGDQGHYDQYQRRHHADE